MTRNTAATRNTNDTNFWCLILLGVLILFAFIVLVIRLAALQIFDAEDYRGKANTQSQRLVVIPAPRGNIYDRNGKLLVGNRPSRNINIELSDLRDEFDKERAKLRSNDARIRTAVNAIASASANDPASAPRLRTDEEKKELRRQLDERKTELSLLAPAIVLQRYLDKINRILDRNETLDLRTLSEHLSLASGKRAIPYTLVRDITAAEAARFVEQFPVSGPLRLHAESIRYYPYGESAAHILGYVSRDARAAIVPGDLKDDAELSTFLALDPKTRNRQTLKRFDGQRPVSGIEARFDRECLSGTPGYQLWTVRPNGYAYAMESNAAARQGAELRLSIDIDFQAAIEKYLATRFPENRAAVVVLAVRTGEILACVNSPSYDPARMSNAAYYKEQAEKENVLNHAVHGLYPPGSSFKPVTAIAALRSGRFTPETIKICGSTYDVGGKQFVEHDRRAFGEVNVTRMLQVSCNVFCYQAGLEIGIERLAGEAKRLGLDSPTTLELGSQGGLIVPDPAYKWRRYGQGWAPGDTANTAIGQGDNRTTVVNLAAMMASIARKETRTAVTLQYLTERDADHRAAKSEPLGLSPENYKAVVDGLVACASPGGTGRRVAEGLGGLPVAAKTGTAQVDNNTRTLAWTIAYAPVEAPQIALAVLVEGKKGEKTLGGGSHAGPVANAVLAEWQKQMKTGK
jgi:penicillin-binding protein 2